MPSSWAELARVKLAPAARSVHLELFAACQCANGWAKGLICGYSDGFWFPLPWLLYYLLALFLKMSFEEMATLFSSVVGKYRRATRPFLPRFVICICCYPIGFDLSSFFFG